MNKTNIYEYYSFGFNYGLIRQGVYGDPTKNVISDLSSFFAILSSINLPVTLNVSRNLKSVCNQLRTITDETIPKEMAEKIETEMKMIDPCLDAELKLKEAFTLTEKRFSLDYLLYNPGKLLGQNVFKSLSDYPKKDFSFACIQIAYNQPTASAFHLMRSLEAQVKELYFAYKKTKRLKKPMWGPMIQELKNKRAPKPSGKLLSHLDSIREHFRNPTQHPNVFYNMDEAQDLLNQTISSLNMIHRELPY